MSKAKLAKGEANKTSKARVNFLYHASQLVHKQRQSIDAAPRQESSPIAGAQQSDTVCAGGNVLEPSTETSEPSRHHGTQTYLTSHLRSVSQKSQIRLAQDLKRTLCKRCNCYLEPSDTAIEVVENSSKGGQKPWADVKVINCKACGTVKRFPVGAKRQGKKAHRIAKQKQKQDEEEQKQVSKTVEAVS